MRNTENRLSLEEMRTMDGEPVWFELANGKWVCYLIYQLGGVPVALGASIFTSGQPEPVEKLLLEGFAFFRHNPELLEAQQAKSVFIFRISAMVKQADAKEIRRRLEKQIQAGLVLLDPMVTYIGREILVDGEEVEIVIKHKEQEDAPCESFQS